jgi:Fe-S cluster biogenesis protein NfuA
LSVTFFQNEASNASTRDSIKSELLELLDSPVGIEIDIPKAKERKTFGPDTPAGRVDKVISERIRPGVNSDGGDVELVELTPEGIAVVRLMGACNGCPSSDATLKNAIEKTLLHFCADDVKEVRQAQPETLDEDFIAAQSTSGMALPSVISHNHHGLPLDKPLTTVEYPIVSLFAKQLDQKVLNRVKFASTVHIPKNSSASIDVWVQCADCGVKKRLEDVNQLVADAQAKSPTINSVGVVICPACAVIVTEK